jgi:hypothetical protein
MYIAYSALQKPATPGMQQSEPSTPTPGSELALRYHAYQIACSKYQREIAAIQKYIPSWQPKFY